MKTREIVIYGILSAVLLAAQVSLGFLPNIEIVTLLILVYTLVFRKKVPGIPSAAMRITWCDGSCR